MSTASNVPQRLWLWPQIVVLIVLRDFGLRYRRHAVAALLFILEPLIIIVALSSVHLYVFGGQPPYGTSTMLFISTGCLPYYIFIRCSRGVSKMRIVDIGDFPIVGDFDFLIARWLVHLLRMTAVSLIILIGLAVYGVDEAIPTQPEICLASAFLLALLALGVGMINSAIASYYRLWLRGYRIGIRAAMIFSGTGLIVRMRPDLREIILWNPLVHGITWFRLGFYPSFPADYLDLRYFLEWTLFVNVVGAVAFANRKR